MTATTHDITLRKPSILSTEKKKEGHQVISTDGLAALGALTAGATVSDVLDICSAEIKKGNAVTPDSIGKATRVDA